VLLRRLESHFAVPGRPTLERIAVRHGEVGVVVDYAALRGRCADSDLGIAMEMNPADALACIAAAVHEVLALLAAQRLYGSAAIRILPFCLSRQSSQQQSPSERSLLPSVT